MTSDTPLTLSHSSNAKLVATYTKPQPGHREKVFVGSPGISPEVSSQVIYTQKSSNFALVDHRSLVMTGDNSGDSLPLRPLRPSAENTMLYVDSNGSLWVQVGDPSETQWFLSDPISSDIIPNAEDDDDIDTHTHTHVCVR